MKQLRTGFSTGACAATAAKAAYLALHGKQPEKDLDILFPDRQYRKMQLQNVSVTGELATAVIIKDAGDDPDVTHGAEITASIQKSSKEEAHPEDFLLDCEGTSIILRGSDGVGLVTRGGLDVPPGKWAINPVPQQMIHDNIVDTGLSDQSTYLLTISVKNGFELAQKTLNPMLGITGGISILGTSGIVVPHSHKAYIDTIKILIKNAFRDNQRQLILCTGAKTHRLAAQDYPDIPDEAFIRIGDFIADTLREAAKYNFNSLVVACMPGKLFKYAMGIEYTHAHHQKLVTADIAPVLQKCGIDEQQITDLIECPTIRELLNNMENTQRQSVINTLTQMAFDNIHQWCIGIDCKIKLYDYD